MIEWISSGCHDSPETEVLFQVKQTSTGDSKRLERLEKTERELDHLYSKVLLYT